MIKLLSILISCLLTTTTVFGGTTQFHPDHAVKIIVPFSVGSGPDAQSRVIADILSKMWEQPVIVENKIGANGAVAVAAYKTEPANGHAFIMVDSGIIVYNPILYQQTFTDFLVLLTPIYTAQWVLFTSPKINTLEGLQQALKTNNTYGSWANGSPAHILGAEFTQELNIVARHVPYKEFSSWYIDTSNELVTFGFSTIGSSKAMLQTGKINYLAVTGNQRSPSYPNVPTLKELTGHDNDTVGWLAYYINNNTPIDIRLQLEHDIRVALSDPRVKESLRKSDYEQPQGTTNDFLNKINKESAKFKQTVKKFNFLADTP